MLNLLFVSISFPPKNDPECLQTAKYFKYLVESQDFAISVVTSKLPTLFMPYDPDLEKYSVACDQLITLPLLETKLTNFILRRILPGGIDYPDSKFSFHLQKKWVINRLKSKPSVIYSRSNPLSSSLLAYKLKQVYNVPWVMHLSDPWVGSPVHSYTGRRLAFHQQWQNKCFQSANAICLTSHKTLEFYKDKYPQHASKFFFFPNVYDPQDIGTHPIDFSKKLRIVYTGGLAGERSAKNFISACEELFKECPTIEDELEVIFAGPLDAANTLIFKKCPLKFVNHIGFLSYKKSLDLMLSAHILLAIDLSIEDSKMAMFFPSKILDYFLAKRRILALTTLGSTTSEVLTNLPATILAYNNIDGIKNFLIEALGQYAKENDVFFNFGNPPEQFNASKNATRLSQLIRSFKP